MLAKVMVVEDERIVAFNLKQRLAKLGYEVPGIAASGAEALRMAEETRPDLVLMDIRIQGEIDGIETALRLKAVRPAPVVYLTAYSDDSTLERARATRPYGYLLKPFSEREMHATIQMALERHRFEGALAESEERLSRALAASNVALWDLDVPSNNLYLSAQWSEMLGGETKPVITTFEELSRLTHPEDRERLLALAVAAQSGSVPAYEFDHRVITCTGEWIWVHSRGRVVERNQSGRALRVTGTNTDITERKRAEQRIRYLATRDALTELPNRALLGDRLDQAIARAGRNRERLALLFIDLDHFKTINDSLGHAIGDALLREVAQRLSRAVRKEDTVARQGGDEFIVLLPGIDGSGGSFAAAEKILQALAQRYDIEGHALHISASIGVAIFPDDGTDPQTLQRGADAALYHAKASGRNRVQFFTERLSEEAQRRHLIGTSLRSTLRGEQLETYYQPKIDLATGAIVGAEALVRWRHPTLGMLFPSDFIGIAEETGVIGELGDWILEEACRGAPALEQAVGHPLFISVNCSAMQFRQKDLGERLSAIFARTGFSPDRLELEITESVLMESREEILTALSNLGAIGVRLALDDFGTGYSSLSYLHRYPIQTLKIDRSFVHDVQHSVGSAVIVRAVIALARSLRLRVVAEGIETMEQLAFLRALQCDEGQGFLFAKPMPLAELRAWAGQLEFSGCLAWVREVAAPSADSAT